MTHAHQRLAIALLLATAALAVPTDLEAARLALTPGPGMRIQRFAAYGAVRRHTVAVTTASAFVIPVEVPPDARLMSAVAVPDRVWTTSVLEDAQPLRFTISFEGDDNVVLYDRTIDIAAHPEDRRWFDFGRDLSALAGQRGTLRFETTQLAPGSGPTLGLWAVPELTRCPEADPSVLLISFDALRADHLSGAGYERRTTPHLDSLAAGATRFTAAFAAAPKTIPSIPQILTGRYFPAHGPATGLAALLGPDRYETSRAIVSNPFATRWLDMQDPGFDTRVAGDLDARDITSSALRFLSAAGRCRVALYLHYIEPHTPYQAPPHYARMFVDTTTPATIGLTFGDVTGAWQGRYGPADRRRIVDLYDGTIAFADRQLGRLLRGLARRGRLENTIVIVTADHGEELWDHGKFFHGQSLYDELLHVPLIVRLPRHGHGRVIDDVVSTVDILPTLLDAAGLPATATDGTSLVPAAAGAAAADAAARIVFASASYAEPRSPPRHAVRSARTKLIRNVADGSLATYDLTSDPEERHPDATPADARELRGVLDAVRLRIAATGYQLRIYSRADQPVDYVLTLGGTPPVPLVNVDRLTLESSDAILVGARSSILTVRGHLHPGDDDHLRLDIPASTGTLKITLRIDGAPAPPGWLRIGATTRARDGTVDLADPALDGVPPARSRSAAPAAVPATRSRSAALAAPPAARPAEPPAAPPAEAPAAPPITLALWRVPIARTSGTPPPLSAEEETRLRSLGYLD